MREAYGSTWLIGIVFTFILLFSGFLSVAVHYSRVFKVKNETLSILEKYEGYNSTSRKIINDYLQNAGYKAKSRCPKSRDSHKYYGEDNLNSTNKILEAKDNSTYYYCIKKNDQNGYDIVLFFKFELPVLGDLGAFNINGKTKSINFDTSDMIK